MALIVSHALPKGLQTFDQIDGVWVTEPRCAVAVAIALRESLIALAAARLAGEGQQTKMELVLRVQCLYWNCKPRHPNPIIRDKSRHCKGRAVSPGRFPSRCVPKATGRLTDESPNLDLPGHLRGKLL